MYEYRQDYNLLMYFIDRNFVLCVTVECSPPNISYPVATVT